MPMTDVRGLSRALICYRKPGICADVKVTPRILGGAKLIHNALAYSNYASGNFLNRTSQTLNTPGFRVEPPRTLLRAPAVGSIGSTDDDDLLDDAKQSMLDFAWGMDKPLKDASPEQRAIVEAIGTGTTNVYVNAVAGSGKTTTLLHVAKALPARRMLVRAC
eukprot:207805-Prorocentrum_minimum.AAC.4